jgi:hypothetical protein
VKFEAKPGHGAELPTVRLMDEWRER